MAKGSYADQTVVRRCAAAAALAVLGLSQAASAEGGALLLERYHDDFRAGMAQILPNAPVFFQEGAPVAPDSLENYSVTADEEAVAGMLPGFKITARFDGERDATFSGTGDQFTHVSLMGLGAAEMTVSGSGSGDGHVQSNWADWIVFELEATSRVTLSGSAKYRGSPFSDSEYKENAYAEVALITAEWDTDSESWGAGTSLMGITGPTHDHLHTGTFDAILPAGAYILSAEGRANLTLLDLAPQGPNFGALAYFQYAADLAVAAAEPDAPPSQFISTAPPETPGAVSASIVGVETFGSLTATYDPQADAQAIFGDTPILPPHVNLIVTDGGSIQAWEVVFDGTFDGQATLTFTYDPDLLPPDLDPDLLGVLHFTGGQWVNVPTLVDADLHTVTVSVSGFSPFVLVNTPEPATLTLVAMGSLVLLRRRVGRG